MMTQLLLALRILKRRSFYTFISLFGIAFTIMALVVVSALGEAALGNNPPLSDRDRLVFATHFRAEQVEPDTSYIIDSALVSGTMRYDTTLQIGEEVSQDNNSMTSYYLYDNFLRNLDGVERSAFAAPTADFNTYLDGRKVELAANYTDADYFKIFDFKWLAGQAYNATQVEAGEAAVVMSDVAALDYFGRADADLIGEALPVGERTYRVVGIVKRPTNASAGVASDIFMPITTAGPSFFGSVEYRGGGLVVFRAPTPEGRARIKQSLNAVAAALQPLPDDPDKNRFHLEGLTYAEEIATHYYGDEGINRERSYGKFFGPLLVLTLMLILLPALNLANVNLSRVFERAPEIAVRKSFGATDGDILRQFLFETLIITIIGGILGVAISFLVIHFANEQEWIRGLQLAFTGRVALYTLGLILVFGLLTGLAPAWRLAQTRIAPALR